MASLGPWKDKKSYVFYSQGSTSAMLCFQWSVYDKTSFNTAGLDCTYFMKQKFCHKQVLIIAGYSHSWVFAQQIGFAASQLFLYSTAEVRCLHGLYQVSF